MPLPRRSSRARARSAKAVDRRLRSTGAHGYRAAVDSIARAEQTLEVLVGLVEVLTHPDLAAQCTQLTADEWSVVANQLGHGFLASADHDLLTIHDALD